MDKIEIANKFKEDIKNYRVLLSAIAERIGVSEDRLTDLSANFEGTQVGRIVKVYDYMGGDPSELVRELSENEFAYECPLTGVIPEDPERTAIEKISEEYMDSSEMCKDMIDRINRGLKAHLICIYGYDGLGKLTMAENLIGKKFKSVGSPLTRGYSHVFIMSDKRSGIHYNYPLGEYLYQLTPNIKASDLLLLKDKDRTEHKLIPIISDGMTGSDYVIYSDAEALNNMNIVCCNQTGIPGNDSSEIEADIMSLADIVVVMLSEPTADYKSKLIQLLHCGWEKWQYSMDSHYIFVIPQSDRYYIDTAESGDKIAKFSKVKNLYSDMLKECIAQVIDIDDQKGAELIEEFEKQLFSYSSIKKNESNDVMDASNNYAFYGTLRQMIPNLNKEKEMSKALLKVILDIKMIRLNRNGDSSESINSVYGKITKSFSDSEKSFRNSFSDRYDDVMKPEKIIALIHDKNFTRKQEDRQMLVSNVNTLLNNAAFNAAGDSFLKMKEEMENILEDFSDQSLKKEIIDRLQSACKKFSNESDDKSDNQVKSGIGKDVSATEAAGSLMLPTLIASLVFPGLAIVGGAVSAYYAQTNFERNTAKKIISSYSAENVKNKITEKIITSYFRPFKKEIISVINEAGQKENTELSEFISRVNDVLSDFVSRETRNKKSE